MALRDWSFGTMTSTALLALAIGASHPAMAGSAALTAPMSSAEEEKWRASWSAGPAPRLDHHGLVSTNAKGEYSFPEPARRRYVRHHHAGPSATRSLDQGRTIDESGSTHLDPASKAPQDVLACK